MRVDLPRFKQSTRSALADERLQQAINNASGKFSQRS